MTDYRTVVSCGTWIWCWNHWFWHFFQCTGRRLWRCRCYGHEQWFFRNAGYCYRRPGYWRNRNDAGRSIRTDSSIVPIKKAGVLKTAPAFLSFYFARVLISVVNLFINPSTSITPRSPSFRDRTATCPFCISLSPITSIYGIFASCASRILLPIFSLRSSTSSLTPYFESFSAIWFAYSNCLSTIGSTFTWTGASHVGNAPAYFSISMAIVRS